MTASRRGVQSSADMAQVIDKPAPKTDPARVMQMVEKARWAAASYATYPRAAVMPIVAAVAKAAAAEARRYAEWAVEETGFGVLEDKVVKNYVATEFLYDHLRDKRSVGVIDEDAERGIRYVAEPIGVVLALLPITNPTSTRSSSSAPSLSRAS